MSGVFDPVCPLHDPCNTPILPIIPSFKVHICMYRYIATMCLPTTYKRFHISDSNLVGVIAKLYLKSSQW